MRERGKDPWRIPLLVVALLVLGNAAWMLLEPSHWYTDLPAGVPDFGAYNEHFVRDLGCAFLSFGVALAWGALRVQWRLPLVTLATLFLAAHALLHVYDTLRGYVEADHWWLDLPLVYLPAAGLVALTAHLWRASGRAEA